MQKQNIFGQTLVSFQPDQSMEGMRLSRAVAQKAGEGLSVRAAKALIDRGRVFVDNQRILKSSTPVQRAQWIEAYVSPPLHQSSLTWEHIVYTGETLIALNKPPGLLVYGRHGISDDTVIPQLERLLKDRGQWQQGDRLTLVHRLDRDTSGLLLVARDKGTALVLEKQFLEHEVQKRYHVLVQGRPERKSFRYIAAVRVKRPPGDYDPDQDLSRSDTARGRAQARKAVTEFRILETFSEYTLMEARPLTGHTHQIRAHMEQLGLPVLGDILYGPKRCDQPLLRAIPRHMLHAASLTMDNPDTGKQLRLKAPLPEDMEEVLSELRQLLAPISRHSRGGGCRRMAPSCHPSESGDP